MKLLAFGAAAIALVAATQVSAQTPAPASGVPTNPGPVLPGICSYSSNILLLRSTAGQAIQTRGQQLTTDVQNELAPYGTAIQTEATALQQGGQAADADGSRRRALQQRVQEAQQLEQRREAELRYTIGEQRRILETTAQPILIAAYQEKGCGVLLDRDSIVYINPAMDLTDTVIQRLNAALPTLSFNRMEVPAQAQAPAQ